MPPGGAVARSEQLATLSKIAHGMAVASVTGRLIKAAGHRTRRDEERDQGGDGAPGQPRLHPQQKTADSVCGRTKSHTLTGATRMDRRAQRPTTSNGLRRG